MQLTRRASPTGPTSRTDEIVGGGGGRGGVGSITGKRMVRDSAALTSPPLPSPPLLCPAQRMVRDRGRLPRDRRASSTCNSLRTGARRPPPTDPRTGRAGHRRRINGVAGAAASAAGPGGGASPSRALWRAARASLEGEALCLVGGLGRVGPRGCSIAAAPLRRWSRRVHPRGSLQVSEDLR